MDQPRVDNATEFVVHPQVLLDRDGEKLAAIVKATFELQDDGALELAPPARTRGIRFADIPWEKTQPESIVFPADVCLRKPGTDVVLVAKAHAPGDDPVPSFDVRVEVGPLKKSLVIFGRRLWVEDGRALTPPAPVLEMELRYDHAWGGRDDDPPAPPLEEARNPIGRGVVRHPSALTHQEAPSIEDPAHPIRSVRTRPPPAGFGVVGRSWEPRRQYAGTYDETWQSFKAPLMPDDFDDRHNLCASPGLIADPPLVGGELVRLLNLTRGGGAVSFTLPRITLEIDFRIPDRDPIAFAPHLDTVLLDLYEAGPEKPVTVELVWRASVPAPRRLREARVRVRERQVPR
ncbi:DUF2169 family type VI secretion system accessory protein [Chondromyces crocatus]|uniref:DUF2169 domain-containing protein n=1 Tax=Chondromyces crocatus TaxID=52 RepID=A0A0K1E818_CHOCO|nr:DUF2169 domain-containing protein [Chondromyces crocatus]AKT37026.1 uncharacterized protein CMC5_011520 [Chondromyces crocatus]